MAPAPAAAGHTGLQYRDLRSELVGRSVDLLWRTIDTTKIRDTHDRWVIGADTARNVPNANAIYTRAALGDARQPAARGVECLVRRLLGGGSGRRRVVRSKRTRTATRPYMEILRQQAVVAD